MRIFKLLGEHWKLLKEINEVLLSSILNKLRQENLTSFDFRNDARLRRSFDRWKYISRWKTFGKHEWMIQEFDGNDWTASRILLNEREQRYKQLTSEFHTCQIHWSEFRELQECSQLENEHRDQNEFARTKKIKIKMKSKADSWFI